MGFERYQKKKYETEFDLLSNCFAPLINAKVRMAMNCLDANSYQEIVFMLKDFAAYYTCPNYTSTENPVMQIYFELCNQAKNFIKIAIERGML